MTGDESACPSLDGRSAFLRLRSDFAALRMTFAAGRVIRLLKLERRYREDQPRIPAGNPDGGQWTDEGGGAAGTSDGRVRVAQAGERSGYPVDILEEDKLGGHTFERHIAKTEEYLKARVLGSRASIPPPGGWAEKRAGSFTSLEAANKLTNSVLSEPENQAKLNAFVERRFPLWLPVLYLFRQFKSPTGYEAYVPNDRSQPTIRDTYSVQVQVRRTDKSPKGYYVHSATPMNED